MTIKFDKRIYSSRPIKAAISAYKGLADFNISSGKKYFEVDLKNVDEELKGVILDEFGNYVLYEFIVDYKYGKN